LIEETGEYEFDFMDEQRDLIEGQCYQAAEYIGENLKRWGRVNVMQYKEKFLTVRCYCSLGFFEIFHGLIYPGYCWIQWPRWMHSIDIFLGCYLSPLVNLFVVPYQKWLYRYLYKKAYKKFPLLKDRLIGFADFPELLKGIGTSS
jgi:hypothetical protein